MKESRKTIIMGAAGRDFHDFNRCYRNNPRYHVEAFTAFQIPGIAGRVYPPELAGSLYPVGIPIHDESELVDLIKTQRHVELNSQVVQASDQLLQLVANLRRF